MADWTRTTSLGDVAGINVERLTSQHSLALFLPALGVTEELVYTPGA